MVTGGRGVGYSFLDSTEIFIDKLPVTIVDLTVATINNRVLLFGNS